MKNLRTYAGAFSRPLKKLGDIITMGHCSFYDAGMQYSLNGNVVALVARDVYSTFGAVCPATSKNTDDTTMTLRMFVGDAQVKRFYSDNADELTNAARLLSIPHEAPQQGMPQPNGIIEREVQDLLTGIRTLLVAAELPGHFGRMPLPATCS